MLSEVSQSQRDRLRFPVSEAPGGVNVGERERMLGARGREGREVFPGTVSIWEEAKVLEVEGG